MGPLVGIKVLDMGTAGVGPRAASLLGMLGADVIKVESPAGDGLRVQAPYFKGISTAYLFCNLNKRCLTIDLKDNANKPVVQRLLKEADVLMHNLRPGVLDRLGLGYDQVRDLNPSIVYVECSAWGFEGEMRDKAGVASTADAFAGLNSLNGEEGGRPERLRYSAFIDFNAANYIAAATLVGIYARDRTGQAQRVQLSQLGCTIAAELTRVAEYFATEEIPIPLGNASANTAPHQAFLCQDGKYLAVGVETHAQWEGLCRALEVQTLMLDPRFTTNVERVKHRDELRQILSEMFKGKPTRWWEIQLEKEGVPHGLFYDFDGLRNHAQVIENEFIPEIEVPGVGQLYTGGVPWRYSKTPTELVASPLPGQQTKDIRKKGFGSTRVMSERKILPHPVGSAPLAGVKVVEASQGVSAPYASLLMALCGAEVVKIEPPGGDYARRFVPLGPDGEGAAYLQLNRNKKGVVLDPRTDEGRQELAALVKETDVFIEDWGPGKADEVGLGYEDMERINPGLVYCAVSAFGEKGPMKDLPGSELVVQAVSGVYRGLGEPGETPVRVGEDIAGLSTGLMAFQAVMGALLHRDRTREGQRIAVSMLGSLLNIWGALWSAYSDPDDWRGQYCDNDIGPRGFGLRTGDGEVSFVIPTFGRQGAEEEQVAFMLELARELGIKEIAENPALLEAEQDPVRTQPLLRDQVLWLRDQLRQNPRIWENHFREMPTEAVVERIFQGPTIAAPVHNLAQALSHRQTSTLCMVSSLRLQGGQNVQVLGLPWQGSWGEIKPAPPPANVNPR